MLSIDENPGQPPRGFFRTNWFCVRAEDYLERGYGHLGLDGKLRKYLLAHVSLSICQVSCLGTLTVTGS
jgi:hypothetical protein